MNPRKSSRELCERVASLIMSCKAYFTKEAAEKLKQTITGAILNDEQLRAQASAQGRHVKVHFELWEPMEVKIRCQ